MPASTIITVLSNVPWGQVVDAAPKIAEGANRLWEAAKRIRKSREISNHPDDPSPRPPDEKLLTERIAAAEATIEQLGAQIEDTVKVVKDLADQNARLVRQMHDGRIRMIRVVSAGAACIVALAFAVVYLIAIR